MTVLTLVSILLAAGAAEDPVSVTYRVTGLFSPDREADLREAAKKVTDATLSSIDYPNGEVTWSYEPSKMPKNAKPEQVQNQIDTQLKNASNHTFSLKPRSTVPRDKLQKLEISVGVLDCKACGFGLYQIVMGVPGVELAFAQYKEGLVTAWIDPEKTDREKVVEALKKREVRVVK
jgi:hypothetical protein